MATPSDRRPAAPPHSHSHPRRRIKYSRAEIQSQLQQLFLFSSIASSTPGPGDTEALAPILSVPYPPRRGAPHLGVRQAADSPPAPPPYRVNIYRSRQQEAYLAALEDFVAEKQREIESVCATNYQVRSS